MRRGLKIQSLELLASMSDSLKIRLVFLCGLRGYHEYRSIWTPTFHEVLEAKQESGNAYDRFAIACTKKLPSRLIESVVGHLPKEVSRYTYYIILHGAKVTAMVIDTHHRRSPLVQGGLEIPIQVTVEMDLTEKNQQCLDRYKTLVGEKYKEPVDGKFEDATDSILQRLKEPEDRGEDTDSNTDLDMDNA